MSVFKRERLIRFSDCDPAGIVFFPQYFVMFNGLVEDWVEEELGIGYRKLVLGRRTGMPTVRLEADFQAISPMGDTVTLSLAVERLGGKSLTLQLACHGAEGDVRMTMRQVIVTTSLDTHRAVDIPADLRATIARWNETTPEAACGRLPLEGATPSDRRSRIRGVRLEVPRPAITVLKEPLMQLLLPRGWPRPKGYANGVVASGRQVFIAGMVGWDAEGRFASDDFAAQARQALQNVVAVLHEAGGKPEHIVRMTWYVTSKREYLAAGKEVGVAFREIIGAYNAAMTAVEVTALMEDRAKVEIEATAMV